MASELLLASSLVIYMRNSQRVASGHAKLRPRLPNTLSVRFHFTNSLMCSCPPVNGHQIRSKWATSAGKATRNHVLFIPGYHGVDSMMQAWRDSH